ncbi:MAG: alpha/beta hydrolase [Candidatus Hydrogenedentota bacterium]
MTSKIALPQRVTATGAGGVPINVWDFGGDGPPLLLCHCTGTHGRIWDPLVPKLAERFHVYAPDTRGHGDSGQPSTKDDYRWSLSGQDVRNVASALGFPPKAFAVGHSAGASHICYAEHQAPGTFGRVVLIDPIIGPAQAFRSENPLAALSRKRKNDFASREEARARYASKPPMNAWRPDVLDAYVEHGLRDVSGGVTLKCPGPIEAMVYEGSGATDVFEDLGRLDLDVLLITSEHSDVRRLVELQKDRFKRVRFEVIPGASHFIPQEKPAEIADYILEWLA